MSSPRRTANRPRRRTQVYRFITYGEILEQITELPDETPNDYAEVGVLEFAPRSGQPQHEGNPKGAVRRWLFGPGEAGSQRCDLLGWRATITSVTVADPAADHAEVVASLAASFTAQ